MEMNRFLSLLLLLVLTPTVHADLLMPEQDSSSLKGKLNAVTGKAATLAVTAKRTGYVLFNVETLPSDILPTDITNARLRVYFPKVTKAGAIEVRTATQAWSEATAGTEPSLSNAPIVTIPAEDMVGKRFAEVDVTAVVQGWLDQPSSNFGFALVGTGLTNVLVGAKEGPGSGYPAVLDIRIERGIGTNLTLGGITTGTFAGDGSALSNLNASHLSSGTLLDGRLSPNVPLLNAGGNAFTGSITANSFFGDGSGLTGIKATSAGDAPTGVIPVVGMVWIQPGTFIMGSRADEPGRSSNEGPQTTVTLTKGFWMGVHEVTQREYQAVTGTNPSFFAGNPEYPVERVTWNDAVAYCSILTTVERSAGRIPANWAYRLPTEAEWEYSCRAGARTTRFCFGDDLEYNAINKYCVSLGSGGPSDVEQRLSNAWGLMDMHGNVYEWCQDWLGPYPGGSVVDPHGPSSGTNHVLRGGAWNEDKEVCRSAQRGFSPGTTFNNFGFRIVLSAQ
jgi:formylglycine-generating enzyme required for sulfatase activity